MRNKKNIIMAVMVAVALLMATGYAYFATNLNINATGNITSSWNVYFSGISVGTIVGTGSNKVTPSVSGTTANMEANLAVPGDSVTYDLTLTNAGTVGAIVEDIKAEATGSSGIKFSITGIKKGDKLAAGANIVIQVKIEYDSSVTSQPTETSKRLTVTIDCVQDIGQAIESGDVEIEGQGAYELVEEEIKLAYGLDIKIGDYVNYSHLNGSNNSASYSVTTDQSGHSETQTAYVADYTGRWQVLGIEDGKLLLVSEYGVGPREGGKVEDASKLSVNRFYFGGPDGVAHIVPTLHEISEMYANGTGAESGRSLTAEDVNKLTGFVPEVGHVYFQNLSMTAYGKILDVYYNGSPKLLININPNSPATNNHEWDFLYEGYEHTSFKEFIWNNDGSGTWKEHTFTTGTDENPTYITTVTDTSYVYYPTTLTEVDGSAGSGISKNSAAYNMLFKNTGEEDTYRNYYWLAAPMTHFDSQGARYGVHYVYKAKVTPQWMAGSISKTDHSGYATVRPVITLSADTELVSAGNNTWNIK